MARLSDEVRAEIGAELLRGTRSLRAIARAFEVSPATVCGIAKKINAPETTERLHTKNATAAVVADNAARRAAIAKKLLDVAERAIEDMNAPAIIYNFGGKDNSYNERAVPRPPTGDQRNLATVAAIALDKHRMLDGYDSDKATASAVDEWLGQMIGRDK